MTGIDEWLESVREERYGMLVDLVFAVVWVTMVELFFQLIDGPTWAYYLMMLAGIAAYFGFVWNLELARSWRDTR